MNKIVAGLVAACVVTTGAGLTAQDFGKDWLVVGSTGRGGRSPVHTDAVEALLVRGQWKAPAEGSVLALPEGKELKWAAAVMEKGRVQAPRGGYAWTTVLSDREQTVLLAGKGHSMVYVNGVPRVGNPYRTEWYRIPVRLEKGTNEFLFRTGRGTIQPKLLPIEKPLTFSGLDHTLPDLIVEERIQTGLGVVLLHAGTTDLQEAWIEIRDPNSGTKGAAQKRILPTIGACSAMKVWISLGGPAPRAAGKYPIRLGLWTKDDKGKPTEADHLDLVLDVKTPQESHKRVYRSLVDGSAQYYAINPPSKAIEVPHHPDPQAGKKALFLSLHGASVEATRQAASYAPKTWGFLAAATNRRPYGFDWEDWGRQDAIDVLDDVERRYPIDRSRVYLTGHSMGGHGTWMIGATYPDRFAALGPSAGWISFWTYSSAARAETNHVVDALLQRAASPSDTLGLKHNYSHHGVYILHGDADDNVPIREARRMWDELADFHHDRRRHEEKGAGHWWNKRDSVGTDCVDWREMFDFFSRRRIPRTGEVRQVDFTTMNPALSGTCHWVEICEQERKLGKSRVQLHFDPIKRRYSGSTENIRCMRLSHRPFPKGEDKFVFAIDGQEFEAVRGKKPDFDLIKNADGKWTCGPTDQALIPEADIFQDSFKQVFARDFILVVGTGGSDQEREWARNKARFDSETFWYRGNGTVEVITDTTYALGKHKGRNVILYGNSETNAAWDSLLGESPIQVKNGEIRIGDPDAGGRAIQGKDLSCLFVQPLPGARQGLVAAISGTGLIGMRLCDRLPYFVSGVHYPDVIVIGSDMLEEGAQGVRGAGFLGRRGGMSGAEIVWR